MEGKAVDTAVASRAASQETIQSGGKTAQNLQFLVVLGSASDEGNSVGDWCSGETTSGLGLNSFSAVIVSSMTACCPKNNS